MNGWKLRVVLAVIAGTALVGCGKSDKAAQDAGVEDSGIADAGEFDGGDPYAGPPPVETVTFESPQEDLGSLQYKPSFEPDYNTLVARPEVQAATQAQTDEVSVFPDRLEYPASRTEVLAWEAGRIVAAAPGAAGSSGKNPFGFARRVVSVAQQGNVIVVMTQAVGLEEMFEEDGGVQLVLDPDGGVDVDLSKADLEWVTQNLYHVDPNAEDMPGELLTDDYVAGQEPLFWGFLSSAVSAVCNVVKEAVQPLVRAITPAYLGEGSVSISPELSTSEYLPLFNIQYSKSFPTSKGTSIKAKLKAQGASDINITLKPGLQFGAKIATPLRTDAHSEYWMNVDSYYHSKIAMDLMLQASIESAGSLSGSALERELNAGTEAAQEFLTAHRERMLGDPDLSPGGGWKRTLLLSKPRTNTFMAGVVPVVVVSTLQVDLECGFQAKAAINTRLAWEKTETFKFQAKYTSGKHKLEITGPAVDRRSNHTLQVTGAGEAAVSCGLIPRMNVMLYDTVGIFAGVRGSLVAGAQYKSSCTSDDPNEFHPVGQVSLGLYANVGIQAGGRVQAPGSSFLGKSGTEAGYDIGPLELYSTQFTLAEKSWDFARGFGYCTPQCRNGKKDGTETDVDCGGACGSCAEGKVCKKNSDCQLRRCGAGKCTVDPCQDGVIDGTETDVDCGGAACGKCAVGKLCGTGSDCATSYCTAATASKRSTCVADHCADGLRDADEGGVDCGGATCAKCAVGVKVSKQADCASGYWNGFACVASHCEDTIKSGNETGPDCGGPTCARRCGYQLACVNSADCVGSLSCGAGACRKQPGQACGGGTECASSYCAAATTPTPNACVASHCADGVKDADEGALDCGGTTCSGCAVGVAVASQADCASGFWNGLACVATHCEDTVKSGDETGPDCGGPTCALRCGYQVACSVDADCGSGLGCGSGVCRKAAGQACSTGAECASSFCAAASALTPNVCVADHCADGLKDADEGNVDCGGATCTKCAVGVVVTSQADCASGFWNGIACVATHCEDTVKSGDETGPDCGGSTCAARCGFQVACGGTSDCDSGLECGGSKICLKPAGQPCTAGTDCASAYCTAANAPSPNTCAADPCSDGTKDGDETGTDCGGTTCAARCGFQGTCNVDADCGSGLGCSAGTCLKAAGEACAVSAECLLNSCVGNLCVTPCLAAGHCTIFVTDLGYSGNLGGLSGADALCQAEASAASLSGTFKAWLSDGTANAKTRLSHASLPYKLVTGTQVASGWTQLTSVAPPPSPATLSAPINKNASGATPSVPANGYVWTGTMYTGEKPATFMNCNDWTSASVGAPPAVIGGDWEVISKWTSENQMACNGQYHLYCLEQ